jgi:hypothetical protein
MPEASDQSKPIPVAQCALCQTLESSNKTDCTLSPAPPYNGFMMAKTFSAAITMPKRLDCSKGVGLCLIIFSREEK